MALVLAVGAASAKLYGLVRNGKTGASSQMVDGPVQLAVAHFNSDATILADQEMRRVLAVATTIAITTSMAATDKRLQAVQTVHQALGTEEI